MKRRCLLFLLTCSFSFFVLTFSFAYADTSSTNYKVESDIVSGGSAFLISSASYKVEEGTLDFATKELLTSTNYKVEGKLGFEGNRNISLIQSINPADYARFFTDQSAAYTVTAQDPDSDALQYRAKQDGTTKAGPQTSSTLTWALGASDQGRRTHTLEVIDPDGTVLKNQAAYVHRRPVK